MRDALHPHTPRVCSYTFLSIICYFCYCFALFSTWLFFRESLPFTRHQVKGEAIFLYPFYHFHPLPRPLDISWVIAAESSPLCIADSRNQTWNTILALVAGVVRRMLKTWVTLGNISCFLSNLTKRLIFAIFKHSYLLPMFTQLTVIFYLSFTNYGCFLPWLLFPMLISVWLVSWYVCSVGNSLFMGRLRIALAFFIVTIAPFCFRISTR